MAQTILDTLRQEFSDLPDATQWVRLVLRLGLAVLLGALIGWERERREAAAGLRTHMLVCLGTATFTLIAAEIHASIVAHPSSATRIDPLHLIEAVAGGLGFLGAGTIIRSGGSVEGLTTAGSLWFVGAIGVAVGGGHLVIAITGVVLALVILGVFGAVERRLSSDG